MSYQPSSMVLFLTNCSLHKKDGGGREYDESQAITSALPERLRDRLLERRAGVFQLVKNGTDFHWQGTPVSQLVYNRELSSGRDVGGRHAAAYLPALYRYEGRFFQALGATGKRKLLESGHHTLFLSGLYGLLRPTEPVQLYSCPLAPQVSELWRKDALLTDVLCEYIRRCHIAQIIDLTAIDAYRQLIDWNRVEATKTDVLHCFDVMVPGDGDLALTAFGKCMAEELLDLTKDEIVDLPSEHRLGTVILRSLGETVIGGPPGTPKLEASDPPPAIRPADDDASDRPWRFGNTTTFRRDVRGHMDRFTRINQATVEICHDPTNRLQDKDIKPLTDLTDYWSYRLGDYRIVYRLDKRQRVVVFERFGHRHEVYEGL